MKHSWFPARLAGLTDLEQDFTRFKRVTDAHVILRGSDQLEILTQGPLRRCLSPNSAAQKV